MTPQVRQCELALRRLKAAHLISLNRDAIIALLLQVRVHYLVEIFWLRVLDEGSKKFTSFGVAGTFEKKPSLSNLTINRTA